MSGSTGSDVFINTRQIGSALTPRERDIVAGVAAGRSNREIARRLGIKERTVKNRLTVIYQKLGVKTRLELAVLASVRDVMGTKVPGRD